MANNISDIESKLAHFSKTIDEIGKDKAVLKLSKQYSREEVSFLMDQLSGRSVAAEKFPSLASKAGMVYPPSYYLEQTSSERTARFKAGLVSGEMLIDMTGGFGVDAYFFSEKIPETWYIEQDPLIYEIASNNLHLLNPAIKTLNGDSVEFLQSLNRKADWLYLDPLRRTKDRRLSRIEEYLPNLNEIKDLLFTHSHRIMVKLSPMTDISQAVNILRGKVSHVYVLSVENECRELLILTGETTHGDPVIESINWTKEKEERFVSVLRHEQPRHAITLSDPLQYLYEPNAAVYKAQQYDELAARYSLFKLHPNTHIYTSDKYYPAYEGRVYKIKGVFSFDAKSFRKMNDGLSFNIKTRNFPLTPAEVSKKMRIKEGGDQYLFCVRTHEEKLRLIVCVMVM